MPNNDAAAFNDQSFQTLYRVDGRPWATIFATGFTAHAPGRRVDLIDYVNENQPSSYISTTVSPYAALAFGGPGVKNLYKIVTNRPRKSVRNFTLPNQYSHQDEVAVIDSIPATHIEWCKQIQVTRRGELATEPRLVAPIPNGSFNPA
jgi:hypothetical protein